MSILASTSISEHPLAVDVARHAADSLEQIAQALPEDDGRAAALELEQHSDAQVEPLAPVFSPLGLRAAAGASLIFTLTVAEAVRSSSPALACIVARVAFVQLFKLLL